MCEKLEKEPKAEALFCCGPAAGDAKPLIRAPTLETAKKNSPLA